MTSLDQAHRDQVRRLLYALDVEGFTPIDLEISAEPSLKTSASDIRAEATPRLDAVRVKKAGVGVFRIAVPQDLIFGVDVLVEQVVRGILESNTATRRIASDLRSRMKKP